MSWANKWLGGWLGGWLGASGNNDSGGWPSLFLQRKKNKKTLGEFHVTLPAISAQFNAQIIKNTELFAALHLSSQVTASRIAQCHITENCNALQADFDASRILSFDVNAPLVLAKQDEWDALHALALDP